MQKFSGKVLRGAGYGRKIGFPTVNIFVSQKDLPSAGVYAGTVFLEGREYKAGVVVGPGEKIEAHILNFSGDLYDKEIEIEIGKFIRNFKKFETEAELKDQIEKDLKFC